MIAEFIHTVLYEYSYIALFLSTVLYFSVLYYGLAPLFDRVCQLLHARGLLNRIVEERPTHEVRRFEWYHSTKSILVFGFSAWPIIYCLRLGQVEVLPDSLWNTISGLIVLTLWNEVHFFTVHRIMHLPFFMKRVHFVHHQSTIPSVYSVYSFHWLEAALLSTVPFTLILFYPLSPIAIFLYPLVSILLNYAGHCNYRFGYGKGEGMNLFATHHNEHHNKRRANYGFAINLLDKLAGYLNKCRK